MRQDFPFAGPIIWFMDITDHRPQWGLAGSLGTAPIGPAMTTLRSVIARLASVVRCAGIACIAVQVIIWNSFYTASLWRLAVPVAVVAWAACGNALPAATFACPLFACADSAVYDRPGPIRQRRPGPGW